MIDGYNEYIERVLEKIRNEEKQKENQENRDIAS